MIPANPAASKLDKSSDVAATFAISIKAVPYKGPLAPPTLEIKAIAVALKTSCKLWSSFNTATTADMPRAILCP